jgi:hypothetical protein
MPQPTNVYSFDAMFTYKFVDMISNENMEPNVITLCNIIPSILSLYYLHNGAYTLFLVFLVVRLVLDCLDGHVARKYNKTSEFGNTLDHYTDMVFYIGLLLLLTAKLGTVTRVLILLLFTVIIERNHVPVLSDLFSIIEDNTVISVPLLSIVCISNGWDQGH